jgi:hypothetical protein
MARFRLVGAFHQGSTRLAAGKAISDGVSPQAGDYIWSGLVSATYNPIMSPLDAGANTIKSGSPYASAGVPCTVSGVQSIDA